MPTQDVRAQAVLATALTIPTNTAAYRSRQFAGHLKQRGETLCRGLATLDAPGIEEVSPAKGERPKPRLSGVLNVRSGRRGLGERWR